MCVLLRHVSVNGLVHVVVAVSSKVLPVVEVGHDVVGALQQEGQG